MAKMGYCANEECKKSGQLISIYARSQCKVCYSRRLRNNKIGFCKNPKCSRKGEMVRIGTRSLCETCDANNIGASCAYCGRRRSLRASRITGELVCHNCYPNYRHVMFREKICQWGPGYAKCILCGTTDLPYHARGLCKSCYRTKDKILYCDTCHCKIGKNFCKLNLHKEAGRLVEKDGKVTRVCYLCKECAKAFDFSWSFGFQNCIGCGETDSPFSGNGLCAACSSAEYLHGLRICKWCGNDETHRSFDTRTVICSMKCVSELEQFIQQKFSSGNQIQKIANECNKSVSFVTRRLRRAGMYTQQYVRQKFGSISVIRHNPELREAKQYFTEEKQVVRELIAEEAARNLSFPLQLVTLPHVNIADIIEFAEWCKIVPEQSLAVEKERKWFNMISSWVNAAHLLPDGHIIKGLNVYNGKLSRALEDVEGIYNCANLDFDGCLSREVLQSLGNLFGYERLADDSVVFITLADSNRFAFNPKMQQLQNASVPSQIALFAEKNGYSSEPLWHIRYKERTSMPMLTMAFKIQRVARTISDAQKSPAKLYVPSEFYAETDSKHLVIAR